MSAVFVSSQLASIIRDGFDHIESAKAAKAAASDFTKDALNPAILQVAADNGIEPSEGDDVYEPVKGLKRRRRKALQLAVLREVYRGLGIDPLKSLDAYDEALSYEEAFTSKVAEQAKELGGRYKSAHNAVSRCLQGLGLGLQATDKPKQKDADDVSDWLAANVSPEVALEGLAIFLEDSGFSPSLAVFKLAELMGVPFKQTDSTVGEEAEEVKPAKAPRKAKAAKA